MIWLRSMALPKASTDSATAWADRLRITTTSGSAPALMNARAVSYSQFVPGNTGISTRGLATFEAGRTRSLASKQPTAGAS